jgi:hypothetical protein
LAVPLKVYHGTDVDSARSVEHGLRRDEWEAIIQQYGGDTKGFSLSSDPKVAEDWAAAQAALRGKTEGIVLEADVNHLPTLYIDSVQGDPNEVFIEPDDFPKVGPGVFKRYGRPVPPLGNPFPRP